MKNYSSFSPTPTEQIPVCMHALMKTWLKMIAGDTGGEITHSQHASDCENSSLFTTSLPPCGSLSHTLFSKIDGSQLAQLSQHCLFLFFFHT